MLAKKSRLPINTFPAKAKTLYKRKYLTVKTNPNGLSYNRLGVIISKKTTSKATGRNRLRRKIFDAFGEVARLRSAEARESGGELRQSFGEGTDLLVIVKPIKLDRDKENELLDEWHQFLRKLI